MKKELICISCPIGCHLDVSWTSEEDIHIEGNKCARGIIYGKEEILAPKRVVTATIALDSVADPRIPVKTDQALLKEHINPLLSKIYTMTLKPPVKMGTVIIEDIAGTGVRLLTTRSSTE